MLIAPKWLKIRTSDLACMLPGTVPTWPLKNFFEKGAWRGSRDPLNFCALNANGSKIVKGTNFKFQIWHTCSQGKSRHDPENFFEKGAWPGSRDPLIIWSLNANSSKMTKATNFKFGMLALRESPDGPTWPRKNFFEKGARPGSPELTP